MKFKTTNVAGALMLLTGLPTIAQESITAKAVAVASCASCPPRHWVTVVEGDPTLFVVSVAVAFFLGIAVGALAAKAFGRNKGR